MQTVLSEAGNLNVYNIHLQCNPPPLCYDFTNITNYLNLPSVQKQIGVANQQITWATCSYSVNGMFLVDELESFRWELPYVLEDNIRVVIYNGDYDLICNWIGGAEWVYSMPWSGQKAYQAAPTQKWTMKNGEAAGTFRNSGLLNFVRVFNAGHMVPHDQPKAALSLLSHLLNDTPF